MLLFIAPDYWTSRLILHPQCSVTPIDARVMTHREVIDLHAQLDLIDQTGRETMEQLQRDAEAGAHNAPRG